MKKKSYVDTGLSVGDLTDESQSFRTLKTRVFSIMVNIPKLSLLSHAAVAFGASLLAISIQRDGDDSGLVVRDESGIIRIQAGILDSVESDSMPAIVFYDKTGKNQVMALSASDDSSEISLSHSDDSCRLNISSTDAETAISLADQSDHARLKLSLNETGGSVLFLDKEQNPRLAMSDGTREVAGLVIGDANGIARAGLFVNDTGPTILLRDHNQQPRLCLEVVDSDGRIRKVDENGQSIELAY